MRLPGDECSPTVAQHSSFTSWETAWDDASGASKPRRQNSIKVFGDKGRRCITVISSKKGLGDP